MGTCPLKPAPRDAERGAVSHSKVHEGRERGQTGAVDVKERKNAARELSGAPGSVPPRRKERALDAYGCLSLHTPDPVHWP